MSSFHSLPRLRVISDRPERLSHNVFGPHNADFHALWNALRDEYETLKLRGYSGEGFLSTGQRLGGHRIPLHEMRRTARASAERRRALTGASSGQRLGGAPVLRGTDMRAVIAHAAARRTTITQGCASGTQIGEREAEQAARNGFMTSAEEEMANESAIAEALWELVQEEEARKAGVQRDAWAKDAGAWDAGMGFEENGVDTGRRGGNGGGRKSPEPVPVPDIGADIPTTLSPSRSATTWPCPVCTLVNPGTYLVCDACGTERVAPGPSPFETPPRQPNVPQTKRSAHSHSDSGLPPQSRKRQRMEAILAGQAGHERAKHAGWLCGSCGTFMENRWWTCSACGRMKESS